jgi:hypothetical protein
VTRRRLAYAGVDYLVSDDFASDYLALLYGRAVDSLSGRPLPPGVSLTGVHDNGLELETAAFVATDGGLFCVAGYQSRVFPDPAVPDIVQLTLSAPGYHPVTVAVNLPAHPVFPIATGDVSMRPLPAGLRGRVTVRATGSAASGALVDFADDPSGALPPNRLHALRTPLAFDHPAGPPLAQPLAAVAGAALHADSAAGAVVVTLNDRTPFQVGDVLYIGDPVGRQAESAVINALGPSAGAIPGDVTLAAALTMPHPAGSPAAGLRAGGVPVGLGLPAVAGDGAVLLAVAPGAAFAGLVLGDPNPAHVERLPVGAVSDVNGYYRVFGAGVQPMAWLAATAAGHGPLPVPVAFDFNAGGNVVDLQVT